MIPITQPDLPSRVEPVGAAEAASLLGLAYPGVFNRTRRRLQRVYDPITRQITSYPSDLSTAEERAFNRDRVLILPEWGGVSWFGSDWTYCRRRCSAPFGDV